LDKLTNTWYRVYDNLYRNNNTERTAYQRMTDFVDGEAAGTTKRFFIPVLFWFCRSPGNYLPLIALNILQRAKASCRIHTRSGYGKTTWARVIKKCQMLVGFF
jgi:hypothetical protein